MKPCKIFEFAHGQQGARASTETRILDKDVSKLSGIRAYLHEIPVLVLV